VNIAARIVIARQPAGGTRRGHHPDAEGRPWAGGPSDERCAGRDDHDAKEKRKEDRRGTEQEGEEDSRGKKKSGRRSEEGKREGGVEKERRVKALGGALSKGEGSARTWKRKKRDRRGRSDDGQKGKVCCKTRRRSRDKMQVRGEGERTEKSQRGIGGRTQTERRDEEYKR